MGGVTRREIGELEGETPGLEEEKVIAGESEEGRERLSLPARRFEREEEARPPRGDFRFFSIGGSSVSR